MVSCLAVYRLVHVVLVGCVSMFLCYDPYDTGEEPGPQSFGVSDLYSLLVLVLRSRGGSRNGEGFGPSRCYGPRDVSPKERGGPWAPPPRIFAFPLTSCALLLVQFLLGFRVLNRYFVSSSGKLCDGLLPFKFCPVYGSLVAIPPLFSLSSLFFSLLRCWETETPLEFWVSLVFLLMASINRIYFLVVTLACKVPQSISMPPPPRVLPLFLIMARCLPCFRGCGVPRVCGVPLACVLAFSLVPTLPS